MAERRIGIIMNGVTGRMGTNQHLVRSILAIRAQGGVALPDGDRLMPDPILVGRNPEKVRALAEGHGISRWSTDLAACLREPEDSLYFDAQTTDRRAEAVRAAIAAGKDVYCEKPIATDLETALDLARLAKEAGIKNGVVQVKLFLPGLRKLKRLVDGGFYGRILAARAEIGNSDFEGDRQTAQRPSWNYRADQGGGIILDMLCHWRNVLDNTLAPNRSVSCMGALHIPQRVDEGGETYESTAEDAAYATFALEGGIIVQMNSSWATRVYRDDLFVLQVDGTEGSAIAGLRECKAQHRAHTPKPVWNPDVPNPHEFRAHWMDVPNNEVFDNGFKIEWEQFLRHLACDEPFPYTFLEGAKGVQLAEAGLRSWEERRWVDLPTLAGE
jgi:predicted dehydrogenase